MTAIPRMEVPRWMVWMMITLILEAAIAYADNPNIVISTIISHLDIQNEKPVDILFYKKSKIIMKIDKDGDIFLRGKWIGKDKRLVHIFDYF